MFEKLKSIFAPKKEEKSEPIVEEAVDKMDVEVEDIQVTEVIEEEIEEPTKKVVQPQEEVEDEVEDEIEISIEDEVEDEIEISIEDEEKKPEEE